MSSESPSKRSLPGWLSGALEVDKALTKQCCEAWDRAYGLMAWRSTFKYLEVSCHGIPWLGGTFAALYFYPEASHTWMNLLYLLLLDIVVVSVLKVIFTRF